MSKEQFTIFGTKYRMGSYILLIRVSRPFELVFGKFQQGKLFTIPEGDYLYIGSALGGGKRGAPLGRRLLRHASRSGSQTPHAIRSAMITLFQTEDFMEAVSGRDIEIMVLDRPNPLGGAIVEGPMLDPAFRSFVGIFPVPVRHGMTAGELALLYCDFKKLDLNLSIIKMEGWRRSMLFPETGLPWIPPSPNMPTFATAEVYPGMCLFEGLNVSEGRGTTTPFQLSGAPFINPDELAERCREYGLEGVLFRPVWFKPTFHKFSGEVIGGIWLHVTDHSRFRSFATGVVITAALHELYTEHLQFLNGVYEFNDTIPAFDLLAGNSSIRNAILNVCATQGTLASWQSDEAQFSTLKQNFHLYE